MISDIQTNLVTYLIQCLAKPVYSFVPPNTTFPYIYINKVCSQDWSCKTWQGYELKFNFSLYDKTSTNARILELTYQFQQAINQFKLAQQDLLLFKILCEDADISFNKNHNLFQANITVKLFLIDKNLILT